MEMWHFSALMFISSWYKVNTFSRPAVVHLNFRAGSTFPVPVVLYSSMDRTSRCNKVDTVRLYASCRLNLLLPKGRICVFYLCLLFTAYFYVPCLQALIIFNVQRKSENSGLSVIFYLNFKISQLQKNF